MACEGAARHNGANDGQRQVSAHCHQRPVREVDAPLARVRRTEERDAAEEHAVHEERQQAAHLRDGCIRGRGVSRKQARLARHAAHAAPRGGALQRQCVCSEVARTARKASSERSRLLRVIHSRQSVPSARRRPALTSAPSSTQQSARGGGGAYARAAAPMAALRQPRTQAGRSGGARRPAKRQQLRPRALRRQHCVWKPAAQRAAAASARGRSFGLRAGLEAAPPASERRAAQHSPPAALAPPHARDAAAMASLLLCLSAPAALHPQQRRAPRRSVRAAAAADGAAPATARALSPLTMSCIARVPACEPDAWRVSQHTAASAARRNRLLPQVRRRQGEHEVRRQRAPAGRHRRGARLWLVAHHGALARGAATHSPCCALRLRCVAQALLSHCAAAACASCRRTAPALR